MVEVDTEAALKIEHDSSLITVLIPLSESPSKTWRDHFRRVSGPMSETTLVNADGRTWIRVQIRTFEIEGSDDAAVERLEQAVELVASANRGEAEHQDQWADFDERLRSWWASQSTR
jgi:hypothetical protein